MRSVRLCVVAFVALFTARADFSYSTAPKASGLAGAPGILPSKYYFKGQKMKIESGENSSIVLDFDTQTVTSINPRQKTYTVTPFSEVGKDLQGVNAKMQAEVKETGEKKNINGYESSQLLMTIKMDNPARQVGMNMQVEIEMWLSPDVPGASELRSFYQKNSPKFPWAALGAGANPGMQNAMVEMQKRMAGSGGGVPVLQILRAKPAGNDAQAAQLQQAMGQARVRLEEMAKQSGPAGDAARQALARMGGGAAGGGALFEMNIESSNFSTGSIPDSVFAVPAGYQKSEAK